MLTSDNDIYRILKLTLTSSSRLSICSICFNFGLSAYQWIA